MSRPCNARDECVGIVLGKEDRRALNAPAGFDESGISVRTFYGALPFEVWSDSDEEGEDDVVLPP